MSWDASKKSILCAAVEKWVRQNGYPCLSSEPLPCHVGPLWCITLSRTVQLLIEDTIVEPVQLISRDDSAGKIVILATLESSDPIFFSALRQVLDSIEF